MKEELNRKNEALTNEDILELNKNTTIERIRAVDNSDLYKDEVKRHDRFKRLILDYVEGTKGRDKNLSSLLQDIEENEKMSEDCKRYMYKLVISYNKWVEENKSNL